MQDRPTPDELLRAVQDFLRDDVQPALEGRTRFHLLVALNLLDVLRRELELEPACRAREGERLAALGLLEPTAEGPPAAAAAPDPAALRAANERLAGAIRAGRYDEGEARRALLAHLRAVVTDKLRVANPAFLERVANEP